jgi:peroxiredoxin
MLFTRRRRNEAVPEVGAEAPEFNLPSAQGGQLRLSMRTARGPVVVVFFRGAWSVEDVAYFQSLSGKEDEINLSGASIVGIGAVEPDEAREFVRASGIKSMVLYDYARITTRQWGLSERDKEHGEYARPAVFVVGTDHKVIHAWTDGLPAVEEIQAKVTEITGLPKPAEEADEEKPRRTKKVNTSEAAPGQAAPADDEPKKMSAEERERIKAERRAAREAGKSLKTTQPGQADAAEGEQAPKKMSKEERERIKAERRAAREAGKSVKTEQGAESGEAPAADEAPKKMSKEERERIKAERRAAREAGQSLKKPADGDQSEEQRDEAEEG